MRLMDVVRRRRASSCLIETLDEGKCPSPSTCDPGIETFDCFSGFLVQILIAELAVIIIVVLSWV
jgi:hypothetical protein